MKIILTLTNIYTTRRFSRIRQISSQNTPVISVLSKNCPSFTSPNVGIFIKFVENFLPMLNHANFNPIQNGLFRDCSRIEGGKKAPSLNSVTHILKWWNLAQLYLLAKEDAKNTWITWHTSWFLLKSAFFIGNQQILLHQEIQI